LEGATLKLARWWSPLAIAVLLAACETAAPASPAGPGSPTPVVKVAFVRDLSTPDAEEHSLPASQAIRLAFETATLQDPGSVPVELEEFDLTQDAADLASIDADPSYVAVIVGPGVNADDAELDTDLPVVSLSGLGVRDGRRAWVRIVPPLATTVDALAGRLRRSSACVLAEDPPPDPLYELLSEALPGATARTVDPSAAASVAREAGCDVVIWAGGPNAGGEAVPSLQRLDVAFIGGDRLLDPDFLSTAGSAAEGAVALCACANVSTSTELAARRFIQDYQSEHGVAPGAFAVEGWDAAHLILRAEGDRGITRAMVARSLGGLTSADGLQGTRRFAADGEPLEPRALLRLYRVEGGRWVRAGWDEI
jgi:branched-chain amino acid transport system substrate-binding protein